MFMLPESVPDGYTMIFPLWHNSHTTAPSCSPKTFVLLPFPCIEMIQCAYGDVDEHSLGSCSAEVAAINANRKEKVKKTNK